MIKTLTYNLNKILLTNEVLNSYVLQFWDEIFPSFNENEPVKHLMVLCKVKYSNLEEVQSNYKTLGPLRRVEFKDLGQFKLAEEHTLLKGVFLAPKVYGLITTEGNEIIKVKDSSKEFIQEKWFKRLIQGDITPKDVAYNLKATSFANKRQNIYKNGIFDHTETKPLKYNIF
jgi:hypothetical protein